MIGNELGWGWYTFIIYHLCTKVDDDMLLDSKESIFAQAQDILYSLG